MATGPIVIAQRSLMRQAYDAGIEQRERIGIRATPFYNERVLIRGQRVDITTLLDAFFFAGYDGEPYPEQPGEKPDAVDTRTGRVSAVEVQPAEARAEDEDGDGAARGSVAGALQKGLDPQGAATSVEGSVSDGRSIPAESN